MSNMDFEIAVRTALVRKKMKISDIAEKLGISIAYTSDIIRGNRNAEHQRKKICEILEIEYNLEKN